MSTTSFVTKGLALAVAVALAAPGIAHAGRGGSAARIRNAVQSGSVDAIIAEVERTERLPCGGCVEVVTDLLDHDRYEVREVAAWWFAKRPALAEDIEVRSYDDLRGSDARLVRNAADFLGTRRRKDAVPALTDLYTAVTSPWSDGMVFALLASIGWVLWAQFLRDTTIEIIEAWRIDYNEHRPHTSLRMATPAAFAAARPFIKRQRAQALEPNEGSPPEPVAALAAPVLSEAYGFS